MLDWIRKAVEPVLVPRARAQLRLQIDYYKKLSQEGKILQLNKKRKLTVVGRNCGA